MLKLMTAMIMCFGTVFSCFSLDVPKKVDFFGNAIPPSSFYTTCGHMHLLVRDFEMAFEDFNRASACLEQFEDSNPLSKAMVLFGQAVACDNLNLREKCDRVLSELILNISQLEEMNDDDHDEELDEEVDAELDEALATIFRGVVDTIMDIALLAPSQDVRDVLVSIVKSMNEQIDIDEKEI